MENEKIGIENLKKITMTPEEKSQVFQNILNTPLIAKPPIKSPYSFISVFTRHNLSYSLAFCLLLIFFGGASYTYFQKQSLENGRVAMINKGGISDNNSFRASNFNQKALPNNLNNTGSTTENSIPTDTKTGANAKMSASTISAPSATMMSPNDLKSARASQIIYQGTGFSFNYDSSAKITSGTLSGGGSYVEISSTDKYNSIHFYPGTLPNNFRPEFFASTTLINGKTFYHGDVQTENGIQRSYMYKKGGKTIVIQNDTLIDLGSIEIN